MGLLLRIPDAFYQAEEPQDLSVSSPAFHNVIRNKHLSVKTSFCFIERPLLCDFFPLPFGLIYIRMLMLALLSEIVCIL